MLAFVVSSWFLKFNFFFFHVCGEEGLAVTSTHNFLTNFSSWRVGHLEGRQSSGQEEPAKNVGKQALWLDEPSAYCFVVDQLDFFTV